jgi:hypothetical protein
MTQLTENDYKDAQKSQNGNIRQDFLDALYLEGIERFVNDVIYMPVDEDETLMSCTNDYFDFPEKFGIAIPKSRRSTLWVHPNGFQLSFPLFLSALIDHEGQHARQNYMKPIFKARAYATELATRNPKKLLYYELLDEIPAYANEVALSELRGIKTESSKHFVLNSIEKIGRLRKRFTPIRNAEEDLRAILCNAPGDDLVRRLLKNKKIQMAIQGKGFK